MIIDIFGSLKENLNKKVRNPFFGTLAIVFVLQNWQLFYSLLFFDSSDNRTVRIDIIESYITQKGGTTKMFLMAVLCSFIVMTISYSLLNASAFISNLFDARVHPWIVNLATKGAKIVTKEKHDLLAERYAKLENQLDDERKKRYEALLRAEDAEKKIEEMQKNISYSTEVARIQETNSLNPEKVVNVILKEPFGIEVFKRVVQNINSKKSYSYSSPEENSIIKLLTLYGVISGDFLGYTFTPFGEKVVANFLARIDE